MLENKILVFIPDTLEKSNVGFLYGFVINIEFQSEFYIIRDKLCMDPNNCIGYCGMSTNFSKHNWLHMNFYDGTLKVNEISCDNNQDYNLIFIIYDYTTFKNSEIIHLDPRSYGEHFNNLSKALKYDGTVNITVLPGFLKNFVNFSLNQMLNIVLLFTILTLNALDSVSQLMNLSNTFSLVYSTFSTLKLLVESILKERKINLKVGNIISSKITDVILGLLILVFISTFNINLSNIFNSTAKALILQLQELLNFLMGSPVGLKLNYAFNNTLGTFFLYHIALWRTFLLVTSPMISNAFTLVSILATFGFSFQMALTADIFTLATFHVYCIYVYAARLYGVQVRGLISLWKLFIGRKQNPLRNRVDSCQYSHHQLFVGILAFTILLFLLPTTLLYYIVFATLRLILNICDELLKWMRNTILTLPLYVTILWAINSPRVKGTICLEITDQITDSETLTLRATLKADPWIRCVSGTRPTYIENPKTTKKSFSTFLHKIAVGDLL